MAARIKVILMERIPRLGGLGDEVAVAAGHARNWLFRQGQAVPATAENRKAFEKRRKELEKRARDQLQQAEELADEWEGLQLRLGVQAGPGGKMYGSVGTRDLMLALKERGFEVQKRQILLPHALRELGEHSFAVQLHPQVRTQVKLLLEVGESGAHLEQALQEDDDAEPATTHTQRDSESV